MGAGAGVCVGSDPQPLPCPVFPPPWGTVSFWALRGDMHSGEHGVGSS